MKRPKKNSKEGLSLIRGVMAQAAEQLDGAPREVSLTGAMQAMTSFAERLQKASRAHPIFATDASEL